MNNTIMRTIKHISGIVIGFTLAILLSINANAQNQTIKSLKVDDGTASTTFNANALVDMQSSNKGLLLPRVALTATNSPSPMSAFVIGMAVFNTATAGTAPYKVTPGFYFSDGIKWIKTISAAPDQTVNVAGLSAGLTSPNDFASATSFDPVTPANTDYIYINTADGTTWTYDAATSMYLSYVAPPSTEWYLTNGTTDAGSNKVSTVYRMGNVAVGTQAPDKLAIVDLTSTEKGFFIPRMNTVQRDALSTTATQDGLMIYNTDEGCIDYWSKTELSWKSLCGVLGAATLDCTGTPTTYGTYTVGTALDNTNYLSIPVNISKPGTYELKGTTTNGYNFYSSGTILSNGIYTLTAMGQGTPKAAATNNVTLTLNGKLSANCGTPTVTVVNSTSVFTMTCGSATVNGTYYVNKVLDGTNTITLPVNVTALGNWSITTNTASGISFSGAGKFTVLGNQNVTLLGSGTPSAAALNAMTLTSSSASGSTTCTVNVTTQYKAKTILHLGDNTYNGDLYASYNMVNASANFGPTGTVKVASFTAASHTSGYYSYGTALQTLLTGASKPDIVVLGYNYAPDAPSCNYLANYMNAGGVVIALIEYQPSVASLLTATMGTTVTSGGAGTAGSLYQLSSTNDAILNGPFGDVRNLYWGEDQSTTARATGVPAAATTYTTSICSNVTTNTGATMVRYKNLFWVGDGGFINNTLANGQIASPTAYPFATDAANAPTGKTGFGTGTGAPKTVNNAIIYANAIAWAIGQSTINP